MNLKTQKFVVPALFVLVVAAIIIGMLALTSQAGNTGKPTGLSVPTSGHHRTAEIKLGSATTTTTVVPTTTPATTVAPVTSKPSVTPAIAEPSTPQTASAPPATVVAPKIVITTTTTTVPAGPIPTSTWATLGTFATSAPDGSTCAPGPYYGCFLTSATVNGQSSPPAGTLEFTIYGNAGNALGTFTPRANGQTYCLIRWYAPTMEAIATSPDCNGSASSPQLVDGFQFSASFAEAGYVSSATGIVQ